MALRTLAGPATVEVEIRRSRFVAHAARVDDLAATLAFYESVADPAATHNCWAWRLDHRYRFNDDGEPVSSAGRPILAAIEGKELELAMVVVTRYFGGVKLGIGGLIRAYSGSAAKCLDRAGILELVPRVDCLIRAGFDWTGQVRLPRRRHRDPHPYRGTQAASAEQPARGHDAGGSAAHACRLKVTPRREAA
jgi:putative IMPACT (imprinted ancient) family translation regulator